MLICPQCGGNCECIIAPWNVGRVYRCATGRRKPGACTNTLTLPMALADDAVLSVLQEDVLGTQLIEELLTFVDQTPDPTRNSRSIGTG